MYLSSDDRRHLYIYQRVFFLFFYFLYSLSDGNYRKFILLELKIMHS